MYLGNSFFRLAIKLETNHKPAKPFTNHPNHQQTIRKPGKPVTNQPQTIHKPAKVPKTSYKLAKPRVNKTFSDNEKHVLNLQSFYAIKSAFSSKDQRQVGIEGK